MFYGTPLRTQPAADNIAQLKADAYHVGCVEKSWELAEQLCIGAIAATMGKDLKLLDSP